jgi:hypothetical protein
VGLFRCIEYLDSFDKLIARGHALHVSVLLRQPISILRLTVVDHLARLRSHQTIDVVQEYIKI